MKQLILLSLLCFGLASCYRLDDTLFNPGETEAYLLNQSEASLETPAEYDIPDSLLHLFPLESQGPDETEATTIWAVYVGEISRIATDTVILYCHGNGGTIDSYWGRIKVLTNVGGRNRYGVLIMDYRGFGLSEGEPTEEGLNADVDACMKWLQAQGLTEDRLAIYGFSLGSAPAAELSAYPRTLVPSWVFLEAPFASAEVIVQDAAGIVMPGSFYTNNKVDVAEDVKEIEQPLFWIHGTADDFLGIETHGEVVWKNYNGVRGLPIRVEGADHGDCVEVYGRAPYSEQVLNFLLNR